MATVPIPTDEQERLAALRALELLDTDPEERFDRVTRIARRIFGTSAATFTLIDADRWWYKSISGNTEGEGPREHSICSHAILSSETTVIEDALRDERFKDDPVVNGPGGIRFYAAHPVRAPGGKVIGTLCVTDEQPRPRDSFDAETLRELAGMIEAEVASQTLAIVDELTGLANRRGFDSLGRRLLLAARRFGLSVSVVYIDLDDLKPINDVHGHEAGDMALIETADLLRDTLRASDLIARLGGDEFCAVLTGSEADTVGVAVERITDELVRRNAVAHHPWKLSLSIGTSCSQGEEDLALSDLVAVADAEMLVRKQSKKESSPDRAGAR